MTLDACHLGCTNRREGEALRTLVSYPSLGGARTPPPQAAPPNDGYETRGHMNRQRPCVGSTTTHSSDKGHPKAPAPLPEAFFPQSAGTKSSPSPLSAISLHPSDPCWVCRQCSSTHRYWPPIPTRNQVCRYALPEKVVIGASTCILIQSLFWI